MAISVAMLVIITRWYKPCQKNLPWVSSPGLPADLQVVTVEEAVDPVDPTSPALSGLVSDVVSLGGVGKDSWNGNLERIDDYIYIYIHIYIYI